MRMSSAAALLDDAVHRIGLPAETLIWLLESEIEAYYLARGQYARARVSLTAGVPKVEAVEIAPVGAMWPEQRFASVWQPSSDAFRRVVDDYARHQIGQLGWEVARARCVAIKDQYSLVELSDHPALDGEIAVLPHGLLGAREASLWRKGMERYVAVYQPRREHYDGAEPWRALEPRFLATRRHSIFLRSLVRNFVGIFPRAEIIGEFGLLILDSDTDLGAFLGKGGENVRALAELAGLTAIKVAHEPSSPRPEGRLKSAIEQLTPVRPADVAITPPAREQDPWTIAVREDETKRLLGRNGNRLTMIARLAGVRVRVELRRMGG